MQTSKRQYLSLSHEMRMFEKNICKELQKSDISFNSDLPVFLIVSLNAPSNHPSDFEGLDVYSQRRREINYILHELKALDIHLANVNMGLKVVNFKEQREDHLLAVKTARLRIDMFRNWLRDVDTCEISSRRMKGTIDPDLRTPREVLLDFEERYWQESSVSANVSVMIMSSIVESLFTPFSRRYAYPMSSFLLELSSETCKSDSFTMKKANRNYSLLSPVDCQKLLFRNDLYLLNGQGIGESESVFSAMNYANRSALVIPDFNIIKRKELALRLIRYCVMRTFNCRELLDASIINNNKIAETVDRISTMTLHPSFKPDDTFVSSNGIVNLLYLRYCKVSKVHDKISEFKRDIRKYMGDVPNLNIGYIFVSWDRVYSNLPVYPSLIDSILAHVNLAIELFHDKPEKKSNHIDKSKLTFPFDIIYDHVSYWLNDMDWFLLSGVNKQFREITLNISTPSWNQNRWRHGHRIITLSIMMNRYLLFDLNYEYTIEGRLYDCETKMFMDKYDYVIDSEPAYQTDINYHWKIRDLILSGNMKSFHGFPKFRPVGRGRGRRQW